MNVDKFLIRFNFVTNLFFIFAIITGGFIWADTNGVWTRAQDVRGGIFGGDEQPQSFYSFINPVILNSSTSYLGVELDNRYVNENQSNSINSNMVAFNYAISNSEGGTALNSFNLNGDNWSGVPEMIDKNNPSYRLNLDGDSILNVTHQDKIYVNELYVNNVKIEDVFQSKVISGNCGSGKYIQAINSDGTITCASDQTGGGGGSTCVNGQTTGNPNSCGGTYYRCEGGTWVQKVANDCGG